MSNNADLKQEEIDDLLNDEDGLCGNEDDTGPQSYDFTNKEVILKTKVPTLSAVNEPFCRAFQKFSNEFTKRKVGLSFLKNKTIKLGNFMQTLECPSSINLVKIANQNIDILFIADSDLTYILVENYFGGAGKNINKLENISELTPTEKRIAERFIQKTIKIYEQTWQDYAQIKLEHVRCEQNPALINFMSQDDVVIVQPIELTVDTCKGSFIIVYPFTSIDWLNSKLEKTHQPIATIDQQCWGNKLKSEIVRVDLDLSCTLLNKQIPLKKLITLKAGDIIPIEMPQKATLVSNGKEIYEGKFGVHNDVYSFKVTNLYSSDK